MLFSDHGHYSYLRSPLIEVICQLRFPTILSIGSVDPAQFQEAVRHSYPRFLAQKEQPAPTVVGAGTAAALEQPPAIMNYHFVSADGLWKINLTKDFIALSTLRYAGWADFARRLDKPLAEFIQSYQPSFFERIGLRYVNAFSRRDLGLEGKLWDDLIMPQYLGVLGEPDVEEGAVTKSSIDTDMTLPDACSMKVHAGPGLLNNGQQDKEVKFILDGDFAASGNISAAQVPEKLDHLHGYAQRLFGAAITAETHTALGPSHAE